MATILESLKGISAYPVPLRTLVVTAEGRGLALEGEATAEVLQGKAYRLATADLMLWVSLAPNVSQGGQSFSFTDEQRLRLRNRAQALYDELEPTGANAQTQYGYKGDSL